MKRNFWNYKFCTKHIFVLYFGKGYAAKMGYNEILAVNKYDGPSKESNRIQLFFGGISYFYRTNSKLNRWASSFKLQIGIVRTEYWNWISYPIRVQSNFWYKVRMLINYFLLAVTFFERRFSLMECFGVGGSNSEPIASVPSVSICLHPIFQMLL